MPPGKGLAAAGTGDREECGRGSHHPSPCDQGHPHTGTSRRYVSTFIATCMQCFNHNLYSGLADTVGVVSTLRARNARQEWERIFNQVYIQPVLEVLSQNCVLPH